MSLPDDDVRAAVEAMLGHPVRGLIWHAEPLDPHLRFHSVTAGVVGVHGDAGGEPFSMVVKQTRLGHDPDPGALWVSGAEPSHRHYWKREWLAYSSGLLGSLPGRLRAPHLYLATEPGPEAAWIWFERVEGVPGERWPLPRYAMAARDLGTTQGAYAAGSAELPDQPWLSHGWMRDWTEATTQAWPLVHDDEAWRDGRLDALRPLRGRVVETLAAMPELLAAADAAPRTVVHLDLWPTNLYATADDETVAIDWSSVGIGGLAADLDQTTLDPVWMQVRPGADLDVLEGPIVTAYAEGLRESGLDVAESEVRRWYAAAAGARYTAMVGLQLEMVADAEKVAATEARWSRPFADVVADRARVVGRALDLAEQALSG
jgi:hypothetical protein